MNSDNNSSVAWCENLDNISLTELVNVVNNQQQTIITATTDNIVLSSPIPYNNFITRYNDKLYEIMGGYFFEEIYDILYCEPEDQEGYARYFKASLYKRYRDNKVAICNIAKTNRNNKRVKHLYKVYNVNANNSKISGATVDKVVWNGISNLMKITDNYNNTIIVTINTQLMGYYGWITVKDLRVGNFLYYCAPLHKKKLYSQIVSIDLVGMGPVYNIQLSNKDAHLLVNNLVVRSSIFKSQNERSDSKDD